MWIGLADAEGRSWYGISSEVAIDPLFNALISGVFRLISPNEPHMSRAQLAAAVVDFCSEAAANSEGFAASSENNIASCC
jgi:hypothetical protein